MPPTPPAGSLAQRYMKVPSIPGQPAVWAGTTNAAIQLQFETNEEAHTISQLDLKLATTSA
jgi:hypothetical protein